MEGYSCVIFQRHWYLVSVYAVTWVWWGCVETIVPTHHLGWGGEWKKLVRTFWRVVCWFLSESFKNIPTLWLSISASRNVSPPPPKKNSKSTRGGGGHYNGKTLETIWYPIRLDRWQYPCTMQYNAAMKRMMQTLYVRHGKIPSYTLMKKKHRAFCGCKINQKALLALSDSLQAFPANPYIFFSWCNCLILPLVSQTVPQHEDGAPGSSDLCPIPELQPWESVLGPPDGDWGLCALAQLRQGVCLPAWCGKFQNLCKCCSFFWCASPCPLLQLIPWLISSDLSLNSISSERPFLIAFNPDLP